VYRNAPPGGLTEPNLVVPGRGIRGAVIGGSTYRQILAEFGKDTDVFPRERGADVSWVNYEGGRYDGARPENVARPAKFEFRYGLLDSIVVGPFQSELYTIGGIRYETPRADVVALCGPDFERFVYGDTIETLRYVGLGIEFNISMEHSTVAHYTVFREQLRG
jgi:hypothetical protein